MTDTSTTTPTIERYLDFWNSGPGTERHELARLVFDPNVTYRAPLGERRGIDALVELAAEFSEHLGSVTMTARTAPDVHHDCARLPWELLRDGKQFAAGTDIVTFDADGRITDIATFLDRAPEGFDPHAGH